MYFILSITKRLCERSTLENVEVQRGVEIVSGGEELQV